MQNVIAIVSMHDEHPQAQHVAPGWADHLTWGIVQEVRQSRRHGILLHPEQLHKDALQQLLEERPMGVVFSEMHETWPQGVELANRFKKAGIPTVVYGDDAPSACHDRVSSDHENGSYLLTRHLIAAGRKRISTVWRDTPAGYWMTQRRAGYERAMRECKLPAMPSIILRRVSELSSSRGEFEKEIAHYAKQMKAYLHADETCDALLLDSDGSVPLMAAVCRACGREPGREVLLAGYDNYWSEAVAYGFESDQPFATVDKRNSLMGRELVRLLMERVEGRLPDAPERRLVAPELVAVASLQNQGQLAAQAAA